MATDPDTVSYAPDNVNDAGAVLIDSTAPQRNALAALRTLVARINDLNLPAEQTADAIAASIAADDSATETLKEALELRADAFFAMSNMVIPFTFEDIDDWITAAAGNPTGSLTVINSADISRDAVFGPEWSKDSATTDQAVYSRYCFRPVPSRVYRVTIKGYAESSNSVDLQAIVAELDTSYAVTAANVAASRNATFTAANTEQSLSFTMSVDNASADVDLGAAPFVRVGASIGPTAGTSTNVRLTEVRVDDITEAFSGVNATEIAAAFAADSSALEALKDTIVADLDLNDAQAIATDLAGDATAMGTLGAAFSGDIDSGALAAGAVQTADIGDGQVTEAKLADGSATAAKLADGGVTESKLADGSVTTAKLADDAVTFPKLLDATGAGYIGAEAAGAFSERTLAQLRGDVFAPAISAATPVGGDHLFLGDASDSDAVKRATIDDILALGGGGLSVADSQNLSAVSSYTLSVPSGAERILIVAADLSVSTFTTGILRIGDAGGVETTNYDTYSYGGNYNPGVGFTNRADSTKGANNFWDTGDSPLFYTSGPNGFKIELYNSGGNEWLCDSIFWSDNNSDHVWGKKMGAKTLSAELTSVELSRASGNFSGNIRSWVA